MADNTELDSTPPGTAPEGPSIPKHRFDEVIERLRNAEHQNNIQKELLNQLRPQGPQRGAEINYEELGLDPSVGRAVAKIAEVIASQRVEAAHRQVQNVLGMTAQRSEEAMFVAQYGKENAKYMDDIRAMRENHYRSTGTVLPVELAYKLVVFDQLQNRTQPKPTQAPAAPQAPATVAPVAPPVPGATAAAPAPAGGTAPGKSFAEMTAEEMESYLDQQAAASGQLF